MNDDHPRKTVDATALAILLDAQNMPQDVQITGMEQLADWPQFVAVWSKLFGDWSIPRSRREWLAACVRADLSPDLFAVEKYTPQDVLAVLAERLTQQKTSSVGKAEPAEDDTTATPAVKPNSTHTIEQYVTLDQAAGMVQRSKYALRNKKNLPSPDIRGGKGKANEWLWSNIRPWLENEFGRNLPERFPSR